MSALPEKPHVFDVAIVGAGLTGIFAGWTSVQRQLSTVIIDSRMIPGSGTTLTSGGSIGLQDKTSDSTIALALESMEVYRTLQGIRQGAFDSLIHWCGGVVPYWTDEDRTPGLELSARLERWGIAVQDMSASDLQKLAPAMSHKLKGAFYCPHEGRINPAQLASAMHSSLLRRFPRLIQWRPLSTVQSITIDGANYVLKIRGPNGVHEYVAGSVILAAGSYSTETVWPVGRQIYPRRGIILTYDALESMDFVMHGTSYISSRDEVEIGPRVAFSFEQRDHLWRIGSSRELIGRSDRQVDRIVRRIRIEAERHIPALRNKTIRRVDICFRPFEPARTDFVSVGDTPYDRVVAINGQEGEGMTLAPALARRAVDFLWPPA